MDAPNVNDMDRIYQEFPRHNWLENKYKEGDIKESTDLSQKTNMADKGHTDPEKPSKDDVDNTESGDNGTMEMEVTTTTATEDYTATGVTDTNSYGEAGSMAQHIG